MSSNIVSEPKFPRAHVQLSGEDGNVFSIIARVRRALKTHGASEAQVAQFTEEMQAGNYDEALRTVMRWVKTS